MKKCTKCKKDLLETEFSKDSQKRDGLRSSCRTCDAIGKNAAYHNNKEHYAKLGKEYRKRCAEEIKERRKRNRGKHNAWLTSWKKRNPDKWKAWLKKDREKLMADPIRKLSKNLRNRLGQAIRKEYKSGKTLELLGCSIAEFKQYIESKWVLGMTWENYGKWEEGKEMTWHIDHIIPCVKFDLTKPEDQCKCFHYTNMQPLWAIDNLRKNDS